MLRSYNLGPYLVTLVNVLARGSHLLFFLIIGNIYGASDVTDTVLYLNAPLLVLMAVVSGAVDAVAMPMFHRADGRDSAQFLFQSAVKYIIRFILPLSILLLFIFSFFRGYHNFLLCTILLPIPLLGSLASLKTGLLNASDKFKSALLGPLFGGFLAVPFVVFAPVNIYCFAASFLLFETGKFFGIFFIKDITTGGKLLKIGNAGEIFQWGLHNARWQILGSFLLSLVLVIDIWFATTLGVGSVTFVEYANKLWNVVPLLFVGHITLTYAALSRSASSGEKKFAPSVVHKTAARYGMIALLLSALFIWMCPFLLKIIYGFGTLTANNLDQLAHLLQYYVLGASPYVCSLVYVKALSAEGRISVITFVAAIGLVCNIFGDFIFIRLLGLNGIGLATSMVYSINMIILLFGYSWIHKSRR
jgi:putative peptidoglycan lipid II flippase